MTKLTSLIAGVTGAVVGGVIIASLWEAIPVSMTLAIIAIILGAILALTGLIVKRSKPKLSASIGRKEFYGVVTVIFGWTQLWITTLGGRIDQLGGRIDQLYQILASME